MLFHLLLDRIDLCVEVDRVQYEELHQETQEESSEVIQKRVCRAREKQAERYKNIGISTNGELSSKEVERFCMLGKTEEELMKQAFVSMNLSARKYYKILAVARTIADLDEEDCIQVRHLREALAYRMIDEKYWGGTL